MRQFVVSSGDAAELLDTTEEALDEVTVFVKSFVERPLNPAVTSWRDHGLNVSGVQVIENGIAVVGFIGAD